MKNQSAGEAIGNFGSILVKVLLVGFIVYFISGMQSDDGDTVVKNNNEDTIAEVIDTPSAEAIDSVEEPKVYQELDYTNIARQKDGMVGEHIYFTGQVLQSGTSWGNIYARVAKNGVSNQVFYVMIAEDKLDINLLENDYVYIEGTLSGLRSYTSVLGSQVTVPEVEADLVELQ